jgi:DNA-binding MarR family transcriptional regulator
MAIEHRYNPPIQTHEAILSDMPPSATKVYKIVRELGPITSKEISKHCTLTPRTIRHVLKQLVETGMLERIPYLLDMRSSKFIVI